MYLDAPLAAGVRVRVQGGQVVVLDGPYSEAKEVVGGYAVFDFPSLEEATEAARRFMELHREHWPGWEGETEVREMYVMTPQQVKAGSACA